MNEQYAATVPSVELEAVLKSCAKEFSVPLLREPSTFRKTLAGRIRFKTFDSAVPERLMAFTVQKKANKILSVMIDSIVILATPNDNWLCPSCGAECHNLCFDERFGCERCVVIPRDRSGNPSYPYRFAYPDVISSDGVEITRIYEQGLKYMRLLSDPPSVFHVRVKGKPAGHFICNADRMPLATWEQTA